MKKRFGVGIVGLQPGRSWAAMAHVPALRALASDYEILGVVNRSLASAEAAAETCGIPHAFAGIEELLAWPDIDVVAVTVKVPHHFEIVKAIIEAGKAVYCEWPLGNGLAEAQELAALARSKGVLNVIGTQARMAAEVQYLKQMVADGFVGEVLSTSIIGSGIAWGAQVDEANSYTLDRANGATMLTIPFGHTMAAVQEVLGDVVDLSASLICRRHNALVVETGETKPMTAHDQVLMNGSLASGAAISVHYRGGMSRGTGFLWEINGSEGDIQVTASGGHAQVLQLSIRAARGEAEALSKVDVPTAYLVGWPEEARVRNVAKVYAAMVSDLRNNTNTAPSFDDAVALHRLIASVETHAKARTRASTGLP